MAGKVYRKSSSSGKTYRKSSSSDMETLVSAAESKGYKAPKEKVGTMTRIANLTSAFEPGDEIATLLRTGDLGQAASQYGSEMVRGVGSAIPFLDKITKPNELASEREGFKSALGELGWNPDTKGGKFAKGAVGLAGDIVLDPIGNLLMGKAFAKGGQMLGEGGKLASKALSKSEKGQDVLKTIAKSKDFVGEAFSKSYKAKKISPKLVDTIDSIKRAMQVGDDDARKIVLDLIKKHGQDAIEKAPYEIEAGGKLSAAAQDMADIYKGLGDKSVAAKLLKKEALLPNYTKHKIIKEPYANFKQSIPEINPTTSFAKERKFNKLIEGEELNWKYAKGQDALYGSMSETMRAVEKKTLIDNLKEGLIKDLNGNSVIRKAGEQGTEGMKTFSSKYLKGYVADQEIVNYLEKVEKVVGDDKTIKGIFDTVDKVQNLWKASVTSVFPAFHLRNAASNIFNNWLADVKNPVSYAESLKLQRGSGKLTGKLKNIFKEADTYEDARRMLQLNGVANYGQFSIDAPEIFGKTIGKKSLLKKVVGTPFEKGRKLGNFVEDNARIAHYIEKVGKGASSDEAVKSVNKFLFDYSDLSQFEKETMKRVMPFYTFTRKNLPLQLEQLYKNPVKYKKVFDTLNAFKSSDLTPEEKKYLPDYLKEKLGIPVGRDTEGMPKILAGLGLPFEQFESIGKPGKAATDLLSPLIKTPFEKVSGQSLFYEKPIEDTSAYKNTTKFIGEIPGLKQFLQARPKVNKAGQTYYEINPDRMYTLKSLLGRAFSTAEKFTDSRMSVPERFMNVLSGLRIYSADIDRVKEEEIIKMLKEMGVYKEFKTEYIPKDVKAELGL